MHLADALVTFVNHFSYWLIRDVQPVLVEILNVQQSAFLFLIPPFMVLVIQCARNVTNYSSVKQIMNCINQELCRTRICEFLTFTKLDDAFSYLQIFMNCFDINNVHISVPP